MPNRRPFAVLLALFMLFAPALFAAAPQGPVAQVSISPNMIQWRVLVPSESLTLRISAPDGETYAFESKGQTVNVSFKDLGESAIDGSFTYDLTATPPVSASTKAKLNDARKNNDAAAARKIARQAGLDTPLVESGAFSVQSGAFVSPGLQESPSKSPAPSSSSAAADGNQAGGRTPGTVTASGRRLQPVVNDQVIADDLIVQGSACIGLDCVINESFGFDTIRLKENNTRIKFEDTSTSAGFPTTDWQLTANDSASGGASKFSIEDVTDGKVPFTVTGNAPTNSLFVDSSGRVGIGTSTPVLQLHQTRNDTPAIRLEQTSAGGFTAQTWDIGANEANFFVRDLTGGSRLPFRIRPGAPTSSIDIAASGNVGIGTAAPGVHVDIQGQQDAMGLRILSTNAAKWTGIQVGRGSSDVDIAIAGGPSGFISGSAVGDFVVRTNAQKQLFSTNNGTSAALTIAATSGNVGIGTTTPSSRLHVDGGDIRVSGGSFIDDNVTLNVPDYVFDQSYKLMPIDQLASYIRTEKHLPNIPEAASVKSQGLNLSQFQMKLLEKVEELTLYAIAQNEHIGTLREQNQQLLQRLNTLEQRLGEIKKP